MPRRPTAAGSFLEFIAREMPPGMAGLMLAGLFAVGFASLLSALNALASAFVTDFYRAARPHRDDRHYLRVSRLGVGAFGLLLGAFALLCVFWQQAQGRTLIDSRSA
jgi:Na+/proline symporter